MSRLPIEQPETALDIQVGRVKDFEAGFNLSGYPFPPEAWIYILFDDVQAHATISPQAYKTRAEVINAARKLVGLNPVASELIPDPG